MNSWYLCKVAYERQADNVGMKKVSESYLIDALSFTEAEERVIREVTAFVSMGALEGQHPPYEDRRDHRCGE